MPPPRLWNLDTLIRQSKASDNNHSFPSLRLFFLSVSKRDWIGCQGRYRHVFQTIHGVSTYSANSPIAAAEPGVGRDKDELEHRFTLLRPEVLETLRQF